MEILEEFVMLLDDFFDFFVIKVVPVLLDQMLSLGLFDFIVPLT